MADKTGDTVVTKTHWWKRRPVLIATTIVLIVVVTTGIVIVRSINRSNEAALAQLKSLQKNLQIALDGANPQGVAYITTSILNGQAQGTFKVTNAELSTYRLDRASAYLNLKQYQSAVTDYEQAATLNSANELAALQGEVEARYKLGDRQQLTSIYQRMIDLDSKSQNPMRGSEITQYKENIQTLQQGGELQFE